MNRQTTALIFILSLLAVFVTNTMADDGATGAPPPTQKVPDAKPVAPETTLAPEPPATNPPEETNEKPVDGSGEEGSGDAAGKSAFAYSAFGAFATALLANFF